MKPIIVKKEPVIGEVTIKYNHYKDKFKISDGTIDYASIDDKYSFSYVFKGNYVLKLKIEKTT